MKPGIFTISTTMASSTETSERCIHRDRDDYSLFYKNSVKVGLTKHDLRGNECCICYGLGIRCGLVRSRTNGLADPGKEAEKSVSRSSSNASSSSTTSKLLGVRQLLLGFYLQHPSFLAQFLYLSLSKRPEVHPLCLLP